MTKLVPRPIDWIDSAPVRIEATATSAAAPEQVFAVLADHERWTEWFPQVRKVEVTGPATGVGARRRVTIPGAKIDEEFIVWEPGQRWSFTGTAATVRLVRSLVEDCRLTSLASGGTAINYTMYLDPPVPMRPLFGLLGSQIAKNNQQAMANLAARAVALH